MNHCASFRRHVFTFFTLALVLFLGLPATNFAQSTTQSKVTDKAAALRQALQEKLDSIHAAGRFPGVTAGVVLGDGTSFGLASGFADTALRIPMKPSDRTSTHGSLAKWPSNSIGISER